MGVTNYNSWREQFVVSASNFTGNTGETGRTVTLTYSPLYSVLSILQQGSPLTYSVDYTYSGQIITFNTIVDDGQLIEINYATAITIPTLSGTSYTAAEYVQAEIRADTAFSSTTTPSLDTVNRWIEEDSRLIELKTGKVFGSTTESSTYFDYDGCGLFRFPESPISSITELLYNVYSNGLEPSWIALEEGFDKNFILYQDEGEIEFISGQNSTHKITPKSGSKRFCVTYVHGYSNVPSHIQKLATLLVAKRVIFSLMSSQGNTEGGNIQVGTISVTDPGSYSVSYMKSLNEEIDRIYRDIGQEFNTFRMTRVYD